MSDRLEDFGRITTEAARKLASRQAEAVNRYGHVLEGFGRGKMSVGQYGAELLSFSFNESLKYAETLASVGSEYLRSAIIIVGGRPTQSAATKTEHAVRRAGHAASAASTKAAAPARRRRKAEIAAKAD